MPSDTKHYGDPRKNAAEESQKKKRGTSQRELSVGFVFFAWIVFFGLWLIAGLLTAAIVFGVLMSVAIAMLNR